MQLKFNGAPRAHLPLVAGDVWMFRLGFFLTFPSCLHLWTTELSREIGTGEEQIFRLVVLLSWRRSWSLWESNISLNYQGSSQGVKPASGEVVILWVTSPAGAGDVLWSSGCPGHCGVVTAGPSTEQSPGIGAVWMARFLVWLPISTKEHPLLYSPKIFQHLCV